MANQFPEWPDRDGQPDRNAPPDADAPRPHDDQIRYGYPPSEYGSAQYQAPSREASEYPGSHQQARQHGAPGYPGPQYPSAQPAAPEYQGSQYPAPQGGEYSGSRHQASGHASPGYPAAQHRALQDEAPQYETPQYEASRQEASGYAGSQHQERQHEVSGYPGPEHPGRRHEAGEYRGPEYGVPQSGGPQAGTHPAGAHQAGGHQYGGQAPRYAEGTYDRLNFQNPGAPAPEHDHPTAGRASVPGPGQTEPRPESAPGPELRPDEHVHSHTHSAATPVSARTRKAVIAILVPAVIATIVGLIWLWPGQIHYSSSTGDSGQQQRAAGTVTEVTEQSCPDTEEAEAAGLTGPCGTAAVKLTDGADKGQTVTIELPQGPGAPVVHADDDVVLVVLSGGQGDDAARYTIVDKQRSGSLWLLVALAAAVVIGFGRLRGLAAIGGLIVSFAVLLLFVLPGVLGGSPPLLVAVVGSSTIMFAVLYLTHGVSVRTSVAILGTLASLVLTGLLGAGFTALTQLTGLGDEQSVYLATVEGGVDMRGLLLAGIIIGSLGVLDDVTITQAEVVSELARTPRSRFDLYRAAIRVGRAHVGSAVNTIVLAYAGASLPLLLLISVSGQSLGSLVTGQSLAQEIVRALVGTIGLVASVPITTALAALVAEPPAEDEEPAEPVAA
ncbi:YibE/F family protein [Cryptosporangium sp. NPDC048952]|uniref:YibE/F family protein n=1 Tax=Cryptosporangium sp. NPDC048952 TaxID=3363961 RepID=UPI0037167439